VQAKNLGNVESEIGFRFSDRNLLTRALTHDSYLNEKKDSNLESNERLEFLGDAVLDLVVSYDGYRNVPGGEKVLHSHWERLTNDANLAETADAIDLTKFLLLSEGERRKSPIEESIRAGAYEAVVGAILVDGGYDAATEFVYRTLISQANSHSVEEIGKASHSG